MFAGSVTKPILAATALKLAEQGVFSLDDKLYTWLPQVRRSKEITLRMMLDHTSGIPEFYRIPSVQKQIANRPFEPWSQDKLVSVLARAKRDWSPGTSWNYSNSNYKLLGVVIERATGKPFDQVVREQILVPSGANRSAHIDRGAGRNPVTVGAYQDFGTGSGISNYAGIYGKGSFVRSTTHASGGFVSTAADLAKVGEGILWRGGAALSKGARAAMLSSADLAKNAGSYGLGIVRVPLYISGKEFPAYFHNGALIGATAFLAHVPALGTTISMMANSGDVDDSMWAELASNLLSVKQ
jgi:D-alanyl-D-alanine carboxypeptidase